MSNKFETHIMHPNLTLSYLNQPNLSPLAYPNMGYQTPKLTLGSLCIYCDVVQTAFHTKLVNFSTIFSEVYLKLIIYNNNAP